MRRSKRPCQRSELKGPGVFSRPFAFRHSIRRLIGISADVATAARSSSCRFQRAGGPMIRKLAAEAIGTFWLVFGGCGSAVLAAAFPQVGIGLLGVALAFGLTVLTMAYSIGHISGCHLNPAVTLGLWSGGRFPARDIIPYWVAQVAGAIIAAGLL